MSPHVIQIGSLRPRGLGARGLEHLARNPGCDRLALLTLARVSPASAMQRVFGEDPRDGQSPFAIQTGHRFEDRLLADDAKSLLALYQQAGALGAHENRVAVLPALVPGTGQRARTLRRARTLAWMRDRMLGRPTPNLIVHPRLHISFGGSRHEIEPDALVARDGERVYRPVELKSYPDRGGKTAASDLRSARRQLAVGVLALREEAEGVVSTLRSGPRPAARTPAHGDLVLRTPGSMRARLHSMALRAEVETIETALAHVEARAGALAASVAGRSLADRAVLVSVPCRLREGCAEHCALRVVCRREAAVAGDPAVLGATAREALAGVDTHRALALVSGVAPTSPEEARVAAALAEAIASLKSGLGGSLALETELSHVG